MYTWNSYLYYFVVWRQLWNFIMLQVKFNRLKRQNEHVERISSKYFVREFYVELSKNGHFRTSINLWSQISNPIDPKIILLSESTSLLLQPSRVCVCLSSHKCKLCHTSAFENLNSFSYRCSNIMLWRAQFWKF